MVVVGMFGLFLEYVFVWWGFVLWARCERQDSGILPLKAGPMVVVGMFGLFLDSFFVWVGVCSLGPM